MIVCIEENLWPYHPNELVTVNFFKTVKISNNLLFYNKHFFFIINYNSFKFIFYNLTLHHCPLYTILVHSLFFLFKFKALLGSNHILLKIS